MNPTIRSHFLRQAGVIRRDQAIAAGLSPHQIQRLLTSQEWVTIRRGVYRLHAAGPLPETPVWAASLWLGENALLADAGASWWWDLLPEAPTSWTFATPVHRRAGGGVRLLDTYVDPADRHHHRGLPVMSKAWCAIRTAAELERGRAGAGIVFVNRVKQTRQATHEELSAALGRHPGCHGSTEMRRLLDRTGDAAHSELERLAVGLLRAAGITGFVLNHWTTLSGGTRAEIDIAFVERRLAIELDGFAFHSSAQAFRDDVRRANLLMNAGWTVRRFTWSDLVHDPEAFVAAVAELLRD